METTVEIKAYAMYNSKYTKGKRAYVARLTGRDSKRTFEREFIGSGAVLVDTPGVYEARGADKRGRAETPEYCVVLEAEDGVEKYEIDRVQAMRITLAMDEGRSIAEIVRIDDYDDVEIMSVVAARKAAAAKTIDDAVAACAGVLADLAVADAKKALTAIRKAVCDRETVATAG